MKTIAKIYMEGKYFTNKANKTIGEASIGPNASQIITNRRLVTSKLTKEGQSKLQEKIKEIENKHNIKILKVKWDKHCGCSMCPCSPGFRIFGDNSIKLKGDLLFEGWIK